MLRDGPQVGEAGQLEHSQQPIIGAQDPHSATGSPGGQLNSCNRLDGSSGATRKPAHVTPNRTVPAEQQRTDLRAPGRGGVRVHRTGEHHDRRVELVGLAAECAAVGTHAVISTHTLHDRGGTENSSRRVFGTRPVVSGMVNETLRPPGAARVTATLKPAAILALMCGAQFIITLDIAIVNVALPAIQADLGLAPSDLQWVVITYVLLLGGLLLLGGRAGDLLGRRRMLLLGLTLFAGASLTAGLAGSFAQLVASRAVQGIGAALAAPAALAVLVATFQEGAARNKALGVFGAAGGSAASFGVVVSGALTAGPGWQWIFFLNVPTVAVMLALIAKYVPADRNIHRGPFDAAGAVTVTAGLTAIVYAINRSVEYGWTSATTLGFLAIGLLSVASFVVIEYRTTAPLVPLSMFRRPTLNAANLVAALVYAAFFATIFQASLLMQQVLGYSALRTGVAYLAIAATSVVAAAGIAPTVLTRFGAGWTLVLAQAGTAAGLIWLARVPMHAAYWPDLFPGFLAVGMGVGLSLVSIQVAAFIGIPEQVSGLAGGMVETAREIGGALGTAIVAAVAIATARSLSAVPNESALTEGFRRGSLVAAGFSLVAVAIAITAVRRAERSAPATASIAEAVR